MVKPGRTKQGLHARTSVDKARKNERAKELKKHKRERAVIRMALAKSGSQRLDYIDKLVDIERQLCGLEERKFHENVLRQKQKMLLSNFEKSRSLFLKSDKPEDKASLERLNETMKDYYGKCSAIRRDAEMLAIARATVVDDIPMPAAGAFTNDAALQPQLRERPLHQQHKPRGSRRRVDGRRALPPGVPVGIPPDFSDSDDEPVRNEHPDMEQNNFGHVIIPVEISQALAAPSLPNAIMMPLRGPPLPPPPQAPFLGQTLTAAPVILRPQLHQHTVESSSSIAAKPQLRDLMSESTRMVPSQLLRAKNNSTKVQAARRVHAPMKNAQTGKTTDEAYDDFMKELDGLL